VYGLQISGIIRGTDVQITEVWSEQLFQYVKSQNP
jgi:hypothetical protein